MKKTFDKRNMNSRLNVEYGKSFDSVVYVQGIISKYKAKIRKDIEGVPEEDRWIFKLIYGDIFDSIMQGKRR